MKVDTKNPLACPHCGASHSDEEYLKEKEIAKALNELVMEKDDKIVILEARIKELEAELADAHCTCEKCGQSHAGCLTLCPRCMSDRERA